MYYNVLFFNCQYKILYLIFSEIQNPPVDRRITCAVGGTRTRTLYGQGILSPRCLPFHHNRVADSISPDRKMSQDRLFDR